MTDRAAYLRALIGKPYREGAAGPDAFDCAGLVTVVSRELFGLVLPGRVETAAARREWKQVTMPVDGAIVMMRRDDTHVGIWLREGGVLHAIDPAGVFFDSLARLSFRSFGKPRFYVPA